MTCKKKKKTVRPGITSRGPMAPFVFFQQKLKQVTISGNYLKMAEK
jgi:hypothetical protein